MRAIFLGCVLLFFTPPCVDAQTKTGAVRADVVVTESNAGTRVVAEFQHSVIVILDAAATGDVWIAPVDAPGSGADNCATAYVAYTGSIRLSRTSGSTDPTGWIFAIRDGWYGQICAILHSGTTDQTLHVLAY